MFFNLFGNYLVSKNIININQFEELKTIQKRTRVKLGLIAVSEKLLTEKQTEEINRKQHIMDKKFGDLAVELNYLSREQVSHLLDLQGNAYMVFCQAVTDKEYLTLPEIEVYFADFCNEYGISDADAPYIKMDDIDHIIPYFLPEKECIYSELIAIAIRTINRVISTDIYIEKGYILDSFKGKNYAYQPLEGDRKVATGLYGKGNDLLVIANTYAGEEFETMDIDSIDAIGEFINIVNGLYATNLSYQKIRVELLPPVLIEDEEKCMPGNKFFIMPIYINSSRINLVFGVY